MRKRIMIIGTKGVGKSSLANMINGENKPVSRCPDVIYGKNTIDVPSAYLENTWMYKYLISLSQDASVIVVVVDTRKQDKIYSHGFSGAFPKKMIGIINVVDDDKSYYDDAVETLKLIGIKPPYFEINLATGQGMEELKEILEINERG